MTEETRLVRNRSNRAEPSRTNRSSSLTGGFDPNIILERELKDSEYSVVGFNNGLIALTEYFVVFVTVGVLCIVYFVTLGVLGIKCCATLGILPRKVCCFTLGVLGIV